jgi:hypothetical protein
MKGFSDDYTVFLTGCRGMAHARLTMVVSLDTHTVQGLTAVPIFDSMAASSPFLVYCLALPLAIGAMLRRQVVMPGSNLCLREVAPPRSQLLIQGRRHRIFKASEHVTPATSHLLQPTEFEALGWK